MTKAWFKTSGASADEVAANFDAGVVAMEATLAVGGRVLMYTSSAT